jgi:8-oxo-dGTP pyrophosphatase MutT (NUDIX family)
MKNPQSGGVEGDESQIQAVKREMLEDVGIDGAPYSPRLVDNQGTGESEKVLKENGETVLCKMQFNYYRIDISEKAAGITMYPTEELPTLQGAALADLEDHKLPSPSVEIFKRLGFIS